MKRGIRSARSWLTGTILLLPFGCTMHRGNTVAVSLESEPPGGEAYVARFTEWVRHGEERSLGSPANLPTAYRKQGLTPVTKHLPMYRFVLIVVRDGEARWSEFTPGQERAVTVRFPDASAPAPEPVAGLAEGGR